MFETLTNTNRTKVLFGSVRCGAELEQTEHDLENVLFCLFVRLAISDDEVWIIKLSSRIRFLWLSFGNGFGD